MKELIVDKATEPLRPTASSPPTTPTSTTSTVLRWVASFVGFPLGGLVAELLVGPVDGLGPALAGGGLSGAVLAAAQRLGLARADAPPAPAWVACTAAGFAVGLGLGSHAVDHRTTTAALALQGAVCGASVGAAQALVLACRLGRLAWAWPGALAALWSLGWTITASIGVDVESRYTVFGSSGAIVVAAVTSVLPLALRRRRLAGGVARCSARH
jgi:hypothetical protein